MESTFTMVETRDTKKTSISIKPYFDNSVSNMGLENYGLSLFDGVIHSEQLACLEKNGVVQYITGLNEFAPDIKLIKDPEERAAKIREIRITVAELERELAANVLDIESPTFWNEVKLLRPDNADFWNKITLACGNEPTFLDHNDPFDRIKICAIEAGGFSLVARTYDEARSKAVPPKFYLDKAQETAGAKTEYKKLKNKALAECKNYLIKTALSCSTLQKQ